jgi:hypothetical protein
MKNDNYFVVYLLIWVFVGAFIGQFVCLKEYSAAYITQ